MSKPTPVPVKPAMKTKSSKYGLQFEKTKRNKIRKLQRQLAQNPNNGKLRESLEHWETAGKRIRRKNKSV